jgi:hypothetical protein
MVEWSRSDAGQYWVAVGAAVLVSIITVLLGRE